MLGPASDGGYYLIGIRHPAWVHVADELFEAVPWGSHQVLAATQEKLCTLGIQVVLLEMLADVDRPEDLTHWEKCRR